MSTVSHDTDKTISRLWFYFGLLATALILVWYLIQPMPAEIGETIELMMFVGLALAVTISFIVVAKQFDFLTSKPGLFMTLIAIGFALWTAAEGSWFYYYLIEQDPFPSIADAFWIIGYFAFIIAFSLNMRSIRMKFNSRFLMIWIILSASIAVIVIGLDILPLLTDIPTMETIITIIYPIEDILVIVPALAILLKFKSGEVAKPWGILILGFMLTVIGDIMFAFAENAGLYSSPYSPVDLFLALGYVACIVSALLFIQIYRQQRVS